jgi:hypothetical protein
MTWQTINKLLNRNKKKEKLSHVFQQKNSDINFSDPVHVITDKFNEYFVNVGPTLAKGIRKNDTISLNIFKINDYLSCLFMYRFKRLQNLPEFFILFILFYKFAIAIDLYRVLWLQMTGISTQR